MQVTALETFTCYFPLLLADHSVDLLLTFPKRALINIARAYGWKGNEKGKDHSFFAEYIHESIESGKLSNGHWILLKLTREQYRKNPESKPDLSKLFSVAERQALAAANAEKVKETIQRFKTKHTNAASLLAEHLF